MQLWVLFAVVLGASETRHFYPYSQYPQYSYHRQLTTTTTQNPVLRRGGYEVARVDDKSYPQNQKYPYSSHRHVSSTTTEPAYLHSVNDVMVVDERTGIQYNPYSKHHPGRHVCTRQRNVTQPVRVKRVVCKPTYKKYMVRCGTQWCEGVRLVYEKFHKEVVANNNHTTVDYTCCPGWSSVHWKSHGCNKPVCSPPCMNGGKCVKPNVCSCPQGAAGRFCETKTSVYAPNGCGNCMAPCDVGVQSICPQCLSIYNPSYPHTCSPCPGVDVRQPCTATPPSTPCPPTSPPGCLPNCLPTCLPTCIITTCPSTCPSECPCHSPGGPVTVYTCNCQKKRNGLQATPPPQKPCTPPCINGGTCSPTERCICPPGYTGKQCETDVDECKQKPCDHICYNTPGSFKCQCKEDFQLQDDGQTCRKENEEASETKDLEAKINLSQKEQEMRMDCISKRLVKLEKMMREQKENGVTKTDLDGIYSNIDKISDDLTAINIKLTQMDCINRELDDFKKSVQCNMGRINSKLGALPKQGMCRNRYDEIPCINTTINRILCCPRQPNMSLQSTENTDGGVTELNDQLQENINEINCRLEYLGNMSSEVKQQKSGNLTTENLSGSTSDLSSIKSEDFAETLRDYDDVDTKPRNVSSSQNLGSQKIQKPSSTSQRSGSPGESVSNIGASRSHSTSATPSEDALGKSSQSFGSKISSDLYPKAPPPSKIDFSQSRNASSRGVVASRSSSATKGINTSGLSTGAPKDTCNRNDCENPGTESPDPSDNKICSPRTCVEFATSDSIYDGGDCFNQENEPPTEEHTSVHATPSQQKSKVLSSTSQHGYSSTDVLDSVQKNVSFHKRKSTHNPSSETIMSEALSGESSRSSPGQVVSEGSGHFTPTIDFWEENGKPRSVTNTPSGSKDWTSGIKLSNSHTNSVSEQKVAPDLRTNSQSRSKETTGRRSANLKETSSRRGGSQRKNSPLHTKECLCCQCVKSRNLSQGKSISHQDTLSQGEGRIASDGQGKMILSPNTRSTGSKSQNVSQQKVSASLPSKTHSQQKCQCPHCEGKRKLIQGKMIPIPNTCSTTSKGTLSQYKDPSKSPISSASVKQSPSRNLEKTSRSKQEISSQNVNNLSSRMPGRSKSELASHHSAPSQADSIKQSQASVSRRGETLSQVDASRSQQKYTSVSQDDYKSRSGVKQATYSLKDSEDSLSQVPIPSNSQGNFIHSPSSRIDSKTALGRNNHYAEYPSQQNVSPSQYKDVAQSSANLKETPSRKSGSRTVEKASRSATPRSVTETYFSRMDSSVGGGQSKSYQEHAEIDGSEEFIPSSRSGIPSRQEISTQRVVSMSTRSQSGVASHRSAPSQANSFKQSQASVNRRGQVNASRSQREYIADQEDIVDEDGREEEFIPSSRTGIPSRQEISSQNVANLSSRMSTRSKSGQASQQIGRSQADSIKRSQASVNRRGETRSQVNASRSQREYIVDPPISSANLKETPSRRSESQSQQKSKRSHSTDCRCCECINKKKLRQDSYKSRSEVEGVVQSHTDSVIQPEYSVSFDEVDDEGRTESYNQGNVVSSPSNRSAGTKGTRSRSGYQNVSQQKVSRSQYEDMAQSPTSAANLKDSPSRRTESLSQQKSNRSQLQGVAQSRTDSMIQPEDTFSYDEVDDEGKTESYSQGNVVSSPSNRSAGSKGTRSRSGHQNVKESPSRRSEARSLQKDSRTSHHGSTKEMTLPRMDSSGRDGQSKTYQEDIVDEDENEDEDGREEEFAPSSRTGIPSRQEISSQNVANLSSRMSTRTKSGLSSQQIGRSQTDAVTRSQASVNRRGETRSQVNASLSQQKPNRSHSTDCRCCECVNKKKLRQDSELEGVAQSHTDSVIQPEDSVSYDEVDDEGRTESYNQGNVVSSPSNRSAGSKGTRSRSGHQNVKESPSRRSEARSLQKDSRISHHGSTKEISLLRMDSSGRDGQSKTYQEDIVDEDENEDEDGREEEFTPISRTGIPSRQEISSQNVANLSSRMSTRTKSGLSSQQIGRSQTDAVTRSQASVNRRGETRSQVNASLSQQKSNRSHSTDCRCCECVNKKKLRQDSELEGVAQSHTDSVIQPEDSVSYDEVDDEGRTESYSQGNVVSSPSNRTAGSKGTRSRSGHQNVSQQKVSRSQYEDMTQPPISSANLKESPSRRSESLSQQKSNRSQVEGVAQSRTDSNIQPEYTVNYDEVDDEGRTESYSQGNVVSSPSNRSAGSKGSRSRSGHQNVKESPSRRSEARSLQKDSRTSHHGSTKEMTLPRMDSSGRDGQEDNVDEDEDGGEEEFAPNSRTGIPSRQEISSQNVKNLSTRISSRSKSGVAVPSQTNSIKRSQASVNRRGETRSQVNASRSQREDIGDSPISSANLKNTPSGKNGSLSQQKSNRTHSIDCRCCGCVNKKKLGQENYKSHSELGNIAESRTDSTVEPEDTLSYDEINDEERTESYSQGNVVSSPSNRSAGSKGPRSRSGHQNVSQQKVSRSQYEDITQSSANLKESPSRRSESSRHEASLPGIDSSGRDEQSYQDNVEEEVENEGSGVEEFTSSSRTGIPSRQKISSQNTAPSQTDSIKPSQTSVNRRGETRSQVNASHSQREYIVDSRIPSANLKETPSRRSESLSQQKSNRSHSMDCRCCECINKKKLGQDNYKSHSEFESVAESRTDPIIEPENNLSYDQVEDEGRTESYSEETISSSQGTGSASSDGRSDHLSQQKISSSQYEDITQSANLKESPSRRSESRSTGKASRSSRQGSIKEPSLPRMDSSVRDEQSKTYQEDIVDEDENEDEDGRQEEFAPSSRTGIPSIQEISSQNLENLSSRMFTLKDEFSSHHANPSQTNSIRQSQTSVNRRGQTSRSQREYIVDPLISSANLKEPPSRRSESLSPQKYSSIHSTNCRCCECVNKKNLSQDNYRSRSELEDSRTESPVQLEDTLRYEEVDDGGKTESHSQGKIVSSPSTRSTGSKGTRSQSGHQTISQQKVFRSQYEDMTQSPTSAANLKESPSRRSESLSQQKSNRSQLEGVAQSRTDSVIQPEDTFSYDEVDDEGRTESYSQGNVVSSPSNRSAGSKGTRSQSGHQTISQQKVSRSQYEDMTQSPTSAANLKESPSRRSESLSQQKSNRSQLEGVAQSRTDSVIQPEDTFSYDEVDDEGRTQSYSQGNVVSSPSNRSAGSKGTRSQSGHQTINQQKVSRSQYEEMAQSLTTAANLKECPSRRSESLSQQKSNRSQLEGVGQSRTDSTIQPEDTFSYDEVDDEGRTESHSQGNVVSSPSNRSAGSKGTRSQSGHQTISQQKVSRSQYEDMTQPPISSANLKESPSRRNESLSQQKYSTIHAADCHCCECINKKNLSQDNYKSRSQYEDMTQSPTSAANLKESPSRKSESRSTGKASRSQLEGVAQSRTDSIIQPEDSVSYDEVDDEGRTQSYSQGNVVSSPSNRSAGSKSTRSQSGHQTISQQKVSRSQYEDMTQSPTSAANLKESPSRRSESRSTGKASRSQLEGVAQSRTDSIIQPEDSVSYDEVDDEGRTKSYSQGKIVSSPSNRSAGSKGTRSQSGHQTISQQKVSRSQYEDMTQSPTSAANLKESPSRRSESRSTGKSSRSQLEGVAQSRTDSIIQPEDSVTYDEVDDEGRTQSYSQGNVVSSPSNRSAGSKGTRSQSGHQTISQQKVSRSQYEDMTQSPTSAANLEESPSRRSESRSTGKASRSQLEGVAQSRTDSIIQPEDSASYDDVVDEGRTESYSQGNVFSSPSNRSAGSKGTRSQSGHQTISHQKVSRSQYEDMTQSPTSAANLKESPSRRSESLSQQKSNRSQLESVAQSRTDSIIQPEDTFSYDEGRTESYSQGNVVSSPSNRSAGSKDTRSQSGHQTISQQKVSRSQYEDMTKSPTSAANLKDSPSRRTESLNQQKYSTIHTADCRCCKCINKKNLSQDSYKSRSQYEDMTQSPTSSANLKESPSRRSESRSLGKPTHTSRQGSVKEASLRRIDSSSRDGQSKTYLEDIVDEDVAPSSRTGIPSRQEISSQNVENSSTRIPSHSKSGVPSQHTAPSQTNSIKRSQASVKRDGQSKSYQDGNIVEDEERDSREEEFPPSSRSGIPSRQEMSSQNVENSSTRLPSRSQSGVATQHTAPSQKNSIKRSQASVNRDGQSKSYQEDNIVKDEERDSREEEFTRSSRSGIPSRQEISSQNVENSSTRIPSRSKSGVSSQHTAPSQTNSIKQSQASVNRDGQSKSYQEGNIVEDKERDSREEEFSPSSRSGIPSRQEMSSQNVEISSTRIPSRSKSGVSSQHTVPSQTNSIKRSQASVNRDGQSKSYQEGNIVEDEEKDSREEEFPRSSRSGIPSRQEMSTRSQVGVTSHHTAPSEADSTRQSQASVNRRGETLSQVIASRSQREYTPSANLNETLSQQKYTSTHSTDCQCCECTKKKNIRPEDTRSYSVENARTESHSHGKVIGSRGTLGRSDQHEASLHEDVVQPPVSSANLKQTASQRSETRSVVSSQNSRPGAARSASHSRVNSSGRDGLPMNYFEEDADENEQRKHREKEITSGIPSTSEDIGSQQGERSSHHTAPAARNSTMQSVNHQEKPDGTPSTSMSQRSDIINLPTTSVSQYETHPKQQPSATDQRKVKISTDNVYVKSDNIPSHGGRESGTVLAEESLNKRTGSPSQGEFTLHPRPLVNESEDTFTHLRDNAGILEEYPKKNANQTTEPQEKIAGSNVSLDRSRDTVHFPTNSLRDYYPEEFVSQPNASISQHNDTVPSPKASVSREETANRKSESRSQHKSIPVYSRGCHCCRCIKKKSPSQDKNPEHSSTGSLTQFIVSILNQHEDDPGTHPSTQREDPQGMIISPSSRSSGNNGTLDRSDHRKQTISHQKVSLSQFAQTPTNSVYLKDSPSRKSNKSLKFSPVDSTTPFNTSIINQHRQPVHSSEDYVDHHSTRNPGTAMANSKVTFNRSVNLTRSGMDSTDQSGYFVSQDGEIVIQQHMEVPSQSEHSMSHHGESVSQHTAKKKNLDEDTNLNHADNVSRQSESHSRTNSVQENKEHRIEFQNQGLISSPRSKSTLGRSDHRVKTMSQQKMPPSRSRNHHEDDVREDEDGDSAREEFTSSSRTERIPSRNETASQRSESRNLGKSSRTSPPEVHHEDRGDREELTPSSRTGMANNEDVSSQPNLDSRSQGGPASHHTAPSKTDATKQSHASVIRRGESGSQPQESSSQHEDITLSRPNSVIQREDSVSPDKRSLDPKSGSHTGKRIGRSANIDSPKRTDAADRNSKVTRSFIGDLNQSGESMTQYEETVIRRHEPLNQSRTNSVTQSVSQHAPEDVNQHNKSLNRLQTSTPRFRECFCPRNDYFRQVSDVPRVDSLKQGGHSVSHHSASLRENDHSMSHHAESAPPSQHEDVVQSPKSSAISANLKETPSRRSESLDQRTSNSSEYTNCGCCDCTTENNLSQEENSKFDSMTEHRDPIHANSISQRESSLSQRGQSASQQKYSTNEIAQSRPDSVTQRESYVSHDNASAGTNVTLDRTRSRIEPAGRSGISMNQDTKIVTQQHEDITHSRTVSGTQREASVTRGASGNPSTTSGDSKIALDRNRDPTSSRMEIPSQSGLSMSSDREIVIQEHEPLSPA